MTTALSLRLADGDTTAMTDIYRRFTPELLRYAGRFVDPTLAEDAVHDALAGTQAALHGRGRQVELRPWLYRCVRNACLSELARAGRCTGELPGDLSAGDSQDVPETAARRERLRQALVSLERLPPRQREALRLRALAGAEYDELAERFQLNENAAVQLVHRARRNLCAAMAA